MMAGLQLPIQVLRWKEFTEAAVTWALHDPCLGVLNQCKHILQLKDLLQVIAPKTRALLEDSEAHLLFPSVKTSHERVQGDGTQQFLLGAKTVRSVAPTDLAHLPCRRTSES